MKKKAPKGVFTDGKYYWKPFPLCAGKGENWEICAHMPSVWQGILCAGERFRQKRVEAQLTHSAQQAGAKLAYEIFNGECCQSEIDRVLAAFKASVATWWSVSAAEKIHDTAKA